jgi:ribosomal protein S18 acetylase RimI-like enzyme
MACLPCHIPTNAVPASNDSSPDQKRFNDTRIIVFNGQEIGWVEFRATEAEVFLRQLYISPTHQRRGIGSRVMRLLLEERRGTAKSMALFVLKNNPAFRFYERQAHYGI